MYHLEILNNKYSTTKLCYKLLDNEYLDPNGKIKDELKFKINKPEFRILDSKIPAKEDEKFDTLLFLPEGEVKKGEGGLRTKGYFKFSYENVIMNDEYLILNDKYGNKFQFDKNSLNNSTLNQLPLITIITVVYNGEKYLEETIQSVINQTYPNVEYIIIDGSSTDGTLDIIKKYEDYIDYWVSERDKGIYDAMNKGIDLASGEWINFMNAGDRFYEEGILEKVFYDKKDLKKYKVIYGDVETIYNDFKKIHKAGNLNNLYKGMQFSHQSTFFNSIYHKKNKYNINFNLGADFLNIILLYAKEGVKSFCYISYPFSSVNTGGVSEKEIFNSVFQHWKAIKNIRKSNILLDSYYIFNLLKQYVKIKFLNEKIINLYRKIKYNGNII